MKIHATWILFLAAMLLSCSNGNRAIGSACKEKQDCSSGLCIQAERWGESTGWKNGYCTKTCSGSCSGRAVCVPLADDSYCLAECSSGSDCRSGYICNSSVNACLPDCRKGWDCGDGYQCASDGTCTKSTGQDLGGPCQLSSECKSEYCIPELKTGQGYAWKDGMCSQTCGNCPTGFSCIALGSDNLCLPDCSGSSNCRDGYLCNPQANVCLPDCRLGWDCGQTLSCNSDGFCAP